MNEIIEEISNVLTPSKKRKRNLDNFAFWSNSTEIPSSTPITSADKSLAKTSFENPSFKGSNKENNFNFMEHKSIAEIAAERSAKNNEFEVIRKPPKKKKKAEDSCFFNAALDLNAIDKPTNPYEVIRDVIPSTKCLEQANHCFANPALNIKMPERLNPTQSLNPFEIQREVLLQPKDTEVHIIKTGADGIENAGLDLKNYALMVPFTPSTNYRINFQDVGKDLTPCTLLATKLVIDGDKVLSSTPKRAAPCRRKSLSVISEEKSELDIGEELDCYQLELENSINEAKLKNQKYRFDTTKTLEKVEETIEEEDEEKEAVVKPPNLTYTKEKSTVEEEINVDGHTSIVSTVSSMSNISSVSSMKATATSSTNEINLIINDKSKNLDLNINIKLNQDQQSVSSVSASCNENADVEYEEVDDDDDDMDFGKPAPFKRAYRKTNDPLPSDNFKVPAPPLAKNPKFGDAIRRSIRKMLNPSTVTSDPETEKHEKEPKESILSSIRSSLRRKKAPLLAPVSMDVSVICDESPRQVFRETARKEPKVGQSEIKPTFLRNSLRRSTNVKKQVMKSVFQQKVEAFELK